MYVHVIIDPILKEAAANAATNSSLPPSGAIGVAVPLEGDELKDDTLQNTGSQ